MKYRHKNDISNFYSVSIIMSFYKKLEDFKRVFPKNVHYFRRPGIELIIIMDEQTEEEELVEMLRKYQDINFKVVVNRNKHSYRNHAKVLNVGLRHASFDYVLSIDPEVELLTDIIYQFRYILHHYPQTFTTGWVTFIDHKDTFEIDKNYLWIPYCSIMARKEDLLAIRGYDEGFEEWGGEDDQIRWRLEMNGIKRMDVLEARTLHREDDCDYHFERSRRIESMPIKLLKHIFYPRKSIFNNEDWGRDFKSIRMDWRIQNLFPMK